MCEKLTVQLFRTHFTLMFLLNCKNNQSLQINFQVIHVFMKNELALKWKKTKKWKLN